MAVQLYVQYPDTTDWIVLDLFATDQEPIKISLSVADIEDPTKVASVFTRQFRVPHTEVNGPFFRAVFNVNTTDFDASRKASAYINDNGAIYTNGNIRLNSVIRNDRDRDVQYEIIFYGDTSDFASKIAGGYMSDLDLSAYNHALNYNNIVNSWTNGVFNGDIVYPLIEWGYTYDPDTKRSILPTLSDGEPESFTRTIKPLQVNQMKPAIRAKALWDAVFTKAGYTYSDDSYMNSALFQNLYVVSDNTASATLETDQSFKASCPTSRFVLQSIRYGDGAVKILAPIIDNNPTNCWNSNLSEYTVPITGTYKFGFDFYLDSYPSQLFPSQGNVTLRNVDTQAVIGTYNFGVARGLISSNITTAVIQQGVRIGFYIEVLAPSGIYTGTGVDLYFGEVFTTFTPNLVNMSALMPTNWKISDFVKSISDKFKFVFIPSKSKNREFQIIPWVDWIRLGRQKDWTSKLDENRDLKISPLFFKQTRNTSYKDIADADYVNINYQYNKKETFGQLNLDSGIEVITGTKVTEGSFATTPLDKIGGKTDASNVFLIPHIAKDTLNTRDPVQPKPRLLFYNGLVDAPATWYLRPDYSPAAITPHTQYPLMSSFQEWPPLASSLDLNWKNTTPVYDITNVFNTTPTSNPTANTYNTVFTQYWGAWYDSVYDPYSRIVEANFVLDYSDISDILFNDYVYVKDAWYFVNSITDYVAGMNTNCKVVLYKIGSNSGIVIPLTAPTNTEVTLCFGGTACDAFCCAGPFRTNTFYVDQTDMTDSNFIYADSLGNVTGYSGFYSDGTTIWEVGNNGVITGTVSPASCDCFPSALNPHTTCYSTVMCTACSCSGSSVTLYTDNLLFWNNLVFWGDSTKTTVPADGWYVFEGQAIYIVDGIGQYIQLCDGCGPGAGTGDTVYDYDLMYSLDNCEACCGGLTPVTYYTMSSVMFDSVRIFTDVDALFPAPAGYYVDASNNSYTVAGEQGNIINVQTCGC